MDLYNWGGRNKLSYKEFIKLGLKTASSKWAYLLSKIYNLVFNLNLKKRSLKRIIVSIRN